MEMVASNFCLMSATEALVSCSINDSLDRSDTTSVMNSINFNVAGSFIIFKKPLAFPSASDVTPFCEGS